MSQRASPVTSSIKGRYRIPYRDKPRVLRPLIAKSTPENGTEAPRSSSQSSDTGSVDSPPSRTPPNSTPSTNKTVKCPFKGCGRKFSGSWRTKSLARHKRDKHGKSNQLQCEHGCELYFTRGDNRSKHYKKSHPGEGPSGI